MVFSVHSGKHEVMNAVMIINRLETSHVERLVNERSWERAITRSRSKQAVRDVNSVPMRARCMHHGCPHAFLRACIVVRLRPCARASLCACDLVRMRPCYFLSRPAFCCSVHSSSFLRDILYIKEQRKRQRKRKQKFSHLVRVNGKRRKRR